MNIFRVTNFPLYLAQQAVSALVDDLHQRGLDQDVTVIAWGEFGRTPKINKIKDILLLNIVLICEMW